MAIKLFDSELKVMNVLWKEGDCTAKHISDVLNAEIGWNINTTYTVIKKCVAKNAIKRTEPHFMCSAIVSKADAQEAHTDELVRKLYDGSICNLFAALLGRKNLTSEQIAELKKIIKNSKIIEK